MCHQNLGPTCVIISQNLYKHQTSKNDFLHHKCSFSKYMGKSHFLVGKVYFFFFIFNGEKWA